MFGLVAVPASQSGIGGVFGQLGIGGSYAVCRVNGWVILSHSSVNVADATFMVQPLPWNLVTSI